VRRQNDQKRDSAAVIAVISRKDPLCDATQVMSYIRALPIGGKAKSPEKRTAIVANSVGEEV
jgi:hypothetical protein